MQAMAPAGNDEPHEGQSVPPPVEGGGMGGKLIDGFDKTPEPPGIGGGRTPEPPGTGGGLPTGKLPLTPAPTGCTPGTMKGF
jgi:hypothetical protein